MTRAKIRGRPWRRPRYWGAASAVLCVGLFGCTLPNTSLLKISTSPSPPVSTPRGLDPGWSLHKDLGAGFTVAFPDAWAKVQKDSPTLAADLVAVDRRTPELGPYFRENLKPGSATGPELLAADPLSLALGYVTNLAVFRSDLGPTGAAPDLEAVRRAKVRALSQDSTIAAPIVQQRVRLAGVEAERLSYGFKAGSRSVHVTAFVMLTDGGAHRYEYELSMGAAIADYGRLFEQVSSSFTLARHAQAPPAVSPSPSR